jgi:mannose-6-phosphate isomerase
MKIVEKPWGREIWWAVTDWYVGKILEVNAGHRLSLQYHQKKHETMMLYEGKAQMELDGKAFKMPHLEGIVIEPGKKHRIEALTNVTIFEVSTPETEDVVRLEDAYGRT